MGNSTLAPTPDSGPLALQPPDLSAADFRLSRRELPVNGRGMSVFVVGREGPREGGSSGGRVPGREGPWLPFRRLTDAAWPPPF